MLTRALLVDGVVELSMGKKKHVVVKRVEFRKRCGGLIHPLTLPSPPEEVE